MPQLLLVATAIGVVALLVVLFRILLLLFGAVLIALLLHAVSCRVSRWTPMPYGLSLGLAIACGCALLGVTAVVAGPHMVGQINAFSSELSASAESALQTLRGAPLGEAIVRSFEPRKLTTLSSSTLLSGASSALGTGAEVIVVIGLGVFLAATPRMYLNGARLMVPPRHRSQADELGAALAHALRWWLVGRLASMAVIGVLTTAGLVALSMPLAVTLGVLAGLLCFIPYVGPLLSAVPALLIALADSPSRALVVGGLYAGIQFVESYLITPLIQLRAVSIPPAALLFAQLVLGLFAGVLGVLLATPVAVLVIVTVQVVYLRGVLGEELRPLGHDRGT